MSARNPIDDIPNDWITVEEAIGHVMAVLKCSREEAIAHLDDFKAEHPDSSKFVGVH